MLTISLKPKAEEDLEHIFAYSFNNFGLARAEEYLEKLNKTFGLLAESPKLGRKQDSISKGLRAFESGSHFIFYRFNSKQLIILRILHKSRLFAKHLST